jgi:dihydrofolate synthase/folylpolyglutamate synthase
MGGRLDATNAADSLVCGITPISMEHTQQLGDTLTAIAGEKAAIIKAVRQTAVCAPQSPEVLSVIEDRCRILGVPLFRIGRDITGEFLEEDMNGQKFLIKGLKDTYQARTTLLGKHQMVNAAVAVGLAESLSRYGTLIGKKAIEGGIEETFWPGRFEIIGKSPYLILDCAHNPASCSVLAETVAEYFPQRKVILILGVSEDKDKRGICQALKPIAHEIILTRAGHPRAYDPGRGELEDTLCPARCLRSGRRWPERRKKMSFS